MSFGESGPKLKGLEEVNQKESREEQDKQVEQKSLERNGKKVLDNALKISPESKSQLESAHTDYKNAMEELYNNPDNQKLSNKEMQQKLSDLADTLILKIREIVGTTEGSQSKQSEDFNKAQKEKDAKQKMTELAEQLEKTRMEKQSEKMANASVIEDENGDTPPGNPESEKGKIMVSQVMEQMNSMA